VRKSIFAIAMLVLCPLALAQQALNNDAVAKLIKAGLSEDLIVSTINGSPGTYDTSADGIIALKAAGASDKVIAAILAKATAPAAPPPAPAVAPLPAAPAVPLRPPGIDDVGVYYKDKSGAWVELMPEVVNFKTGGVLKAIATEGLVKGDINGHIPGKRARTAIAFPVVLAVFVPEGTEITEYQLLRLRGSGNAREFRSVTGGVLHQSGGVKRDLVDYQPQKIAPRVYQITLDPSLGRGEYGLLPPGAYGSSNMGSSGKIYSISIPE